CSSDLVGAVGGGVEVAAEEGGGGVVDRHLQRLGAVGGAQGDVDRRGRGDQLAGGAELQVGGDRAGAVVDQGAVDGVVDGHVVAGAAHEVLAEGVLAAQRVVQAGDLHAVVGSGIGHVERRGRRLPVGGHVAGVVQRAAGGGGHGLGRHAQVAQHAAGGGAVALHATADGVHHEAVLVHVELADARIDHRAVAVAGDEEA